MLLVADNWGSVLTKLIPLGLVIALSPITVIPAVLVLHAPRPRPTGLAFLAGWVLGLAALTAAFVGASDLLGGLQLHKVVEGRLSCWGLCEQGDWWGLVTYPIAYRSRQKTVTHWIPAWTLRRKG